MKKSSVFLIICFPIALLSQEKLSVEYNGICRSSEYGETIEIVNDSVIIYQETNGKLLKRQFTKGLINGTTLHLNSTVPFGGPTSFNILLSDNILTLIENHSGSIYHYNRLIKRPPVLDNSSEPLLNLEYFWNMQNERYPYFKQRHIDWDSAKNHILSLDKSELREEDLWENLKILVDYFDTDSHIWIADSKGEDFYTPKNSAPKKSIRPKKELLLLIGEKYLDNHDYLTTANGKIIYKYLPDSIGYINIMSFYNMSQSSLKEDQLKDLFNELETLYLYFRAAKGLIIDVRYNGGGNDWNALAVAGLFVSNNFPVTSRRARIQGTEKFGHPKVSQVSALQKNFSELEKVVLSSRYSASATESFLIAALNFSKSKIIGEPSKGILSDSYVFELPNGSFFGTYSDKVYSFDGKIYENIGVPVDIRIEMNENDFKEGKDTVMEYAISHLKKSKALYTK